MLPPHAQLFVLCIGCIGFACDSESPGRVSSGSPQNADGGSGRQLPGDSPSIQSLEPTEVLVGREAVTLVFTGEGFSANGSAPGIVWSATGRSTTLPATVENANRFTAIVPAELLAIPTLAWVVVWQGTPYTTNPLWSGVLAVRPLPPAGETSFTRAAKMKQPRASHQAVLLQDGRVLIVGGDQHMAELYDPVTDQFELTGGMQTVRIGGSATLLASGRVLVAGGLGAFVPPNGPRETLSSAEIYDPAGGTFTPTGGMSEPRAFHTATLLKDGRVLVAGGNFWPTIASAEIYDPVTGSFTAAGDMSTSRTGHTANLLPSGQVLIAGGWNGYFADAVDDPPWDPLGTEVFDPATDRFSVGAQMSATRSWHQAVELGDRRVLLLGGIPAIQNLHGGTTPHPKYAEIFDPARSQLLAGPDAIGAVQTRYTATLLPDGGILLAGGEENFRAVDSAAVLDVGSGRLVPIPGLSIPRVGHTATRLADGRILVVGGVDQNQKPLASAEIFQ